MGVQGWQWGVDVFREEAVSVRVEDGRGRLLPHFSPPALFVLTLCWMGGMFVLLHEDLALACWRDPATSLCTGLTV